MAFVCPNCQADAARLIIFNEPRYLGCENCGVASKPFVNVNLGQTVEKWEHVNKQGELKKHRLTYGKDWEISNRAVAEDGKTVINKVTQKEAQY